MRRSLAVTTLLWSLSAMAAVYQGIDPDGRVFYSDKPVENARLLDIPAASTPPPVSPGPDRPADAFIGPYTDFEIVTPAQDETIRDDEGRLSISLLLVPALQEGHRLSLEVDGVPARGDLGESMQLELGGLRFGSHRLQAMIQDAAGETIATTVIVHVHLRRPVPAGALP